MATKALLADLANAYETRSKHMVVIESVGGVVQVERLRVELGGEALDPLRAHDDLPERPEAQTDREVFEETSSWPHGGPFRLTYKGA